jgi:hypothetical protein
MPETFINTARHRDNEAVAEYGPIYPNDIAIVHSRGTSWYVFEAKSKATNSGADGFLTR